MKIKNIYIYGAGSSGIEILELLNIINKTTKQWNIKGFIDIDKKKIGKSIKKYKVYDDSKVKKNKNDYGICSVANPKIKEKILKNLNKKFKTTNLFHPELYLPDDIKIGKGNVIFSNVHLSYNVKIGDNCLISFGCDIGHDTKIDNFSSIMPGTIINGKVNIGKKCYIGSSALISVGVKIGNNCKVGSGTKIFKKILSNTNVFEIPRIMKNKI